MAELIPTGQPEEQQDDDRKRLIDFAAASQARPLIPTRQAPAAPAAPEISAAPAAPAAAPLVGPQAQPKAPLIPGIPVQRPDAKNPVPGTQRVETDGTGASRNVVTPYSVAQQMNPFAGIFAHSDNIHNPILRTIAKIGSGVAAGVESAGQGMFPELAKQEEQRIALPGTLKEQEAKTRLEGAQATEAEAKAKATQTGEANWEPMQGEQFTQYAVNGDGSQGAPVANLWRNKVTGAQEWRPVPAPLIGGQPPAAAPAAQPTAPLVGGGAQAPAPAAGGQPLVGPQPTTQFGTKQMTKPEERAFGDAETKRAQGEIDQAAKNIPPGYSIDIPKPEKGVDNEVSWRQKVKDFENAKNVAVAQQKAAEAELNKQRDAQAAADRKEIAAAKKQRVYAMEADGSLKYMTQYEADQAKLSSQPVNGPGQPNVKSDMNAIRMLNDVQSNTSHYVKAGQDYAKKLETQSGFDRAKDLTLMNGILNSAGIADFKVNIGEGKIELPFLSSFTEGLSRAMRGKDYNELSPEGRKLIDGYYQAMSAIPAYQKALTGIGRSNKEMLELELNNIPLPTMAADPTWGRGRAGADNLLSKLSRFQENIDRAADGFPTNFQGIPDIKKIRQDIENPAPKPKVLPNDIGDLINFANKKPQ